MGFSGDKPVPPLPYRRSPSISPQGKGASAASLVEHILQCGPRSNSDALRELRAAFPDSPLTVRVAALDLMRRRSLAT